MCSPTTGGEDGPEEFAGKLDDRATDVLEDGEYVTFSEHNDERD